MAKAKVSMAWFDQRLDELENVLRKGSSTASFNELSSIIELLSSVKYENARKIFQKVFKICERQEIVSTELLLNMIYLNCHRILSQPSYDLKRSDFIENPSLLKSCKAVCQKIYEVSSAGKGLRMSSGITEIHLAKEEFYAFINLIDVFIDDAELIEVINNLYINVYIARHGIHVYGYVEELYYKLLHALSFISCNDKQLARDVAEEVMFCSEDDRVSHLGYALLSSIYTSQGLMPEYLVYTVAAVMRVKNVDTMSSEFKYIILRNCVMCLRMLNQYDCGKKICEDMLDAKCYFDDQSERWLNNLLFSCMIMDGRVVEMMGEYLQNNIASIIDRGEVLPWLSLVSEVRRIHPERAEVLKPFVEKLKEQLGAGASGYFLDKEVGSDLAKRIDDVHDSRDFVNIAAAMKRLYPVVQKALAEAFNRKDYSTIMLCHYALSKPFSIKNEFECEFTRLKDLCSGNGLFSSRYLENVHNQMSLNDKKCYIYLFDYCNDICALVWCSGEMLFYNKLANMSEFNEAASFIERDIKCVSPVLIIKNAINLEINIDKDVEHIIFLMSLNLFHYPINLIKIKEQLVSDMACVSSAMPSIFSWHSKKDRHYSSDVIVKKFDQNDELTNGVCLELVNSNIVNECDIVCYDNFLKSKLIAFIGHGNISASGDLKIQVGDALLNAHALADSCVCDIAIFFVCFSGKSHAKIFSNNISSLTSILFDAGVKHVLAPTWSLPAPIVRPWFEIFLKEQSNSGDVARSCFKANMHLKSHNFYIDSYACMHHFVG